MRIGPLHADRNAQVAMPPRMLMLIDNAMSRVMGDPPGYSFVWYCSDVPGCRVWNLDMICEE
jgi:hypothetical protein